MLNRISQKQRFQNLLFQQTDRIGDALDAILDHTDEAQDTQAIRNQADVIGKRAKHIQRLTTDYDNHKVH